MNFKDFYELFEPQINKARPSEDTMHTIISQAVQNSFGHLGQVTNRANSNSHSEFHINSSTRKIDIEMSMRKVKFVFANESILDREQIIPQISINFDWNPSYKVQPSVKDDQDFYVVGQTLNSETMPIFKALKNFLNQLNQYPIGVSYTSLNDPTNGSRRENVYSKIMISAGFVLTSNDVWIPKKFKK